MTLLKSAKTVAIACALLLTVCASPGWSQGNFGANISGGLATPVGDFSDWANLGFGLHGSAYIEFSPVAAAGIGLGFNRFSVEDGGGSIDGGEPSILSICPEIRFMAGTGDMGTFAFILGGGWYRLMQADATITEENPITEEVEEVTFEFDSLSEFGMNAAGQALYPISDTVKIGAEARLHMIFTDEETTTFLDFMAVFTFTTGT